MRRRAEAADAHYAEILGFVRRRVDSVADAEDVTQDVFAAVAESLARSAGSAPPTLGWLYTVARRRIVDRLRRPGPETVSFDVAGEPEALDRDYGTLVARTLQRGLASMPEAQRRVVSLRLLEGRSFAEIADRLDATEDACRMRFLRGLRRLRRTFEEEGLAP
ncbi:MAG TPA: RNA polymerase sigma factor [Gaiellaceae bacterium]|jgi:RNA polymerase sigma-70 factor (ECF subfamily)